MSDEKQFLAANELSLPQLVDLKNWMEDDTAINIFYKLLATKESQAIEALIYKDDERQRGTIQTLRWFVDLHDVVIDLIKEVSAENDMKVLDTNEGVK